MVLGSICFQNFHYLMVVWVKMTLFWELIGAHRCILIITNSGKDILILGKDLTQGLDDTTLIAEAQ